MNPLLCISTKKTTIKNGVHEEESCKPIPEKFTVSTEEKFIPGPIVAAAAAAVAGIAVDQAIKAIEEECLAILLDLRADL